jgi:hypothetical protein
MEDERFKNELLQDMKSISGDVYTDIKTVGNLFTVWFLSRILEIKNDDIDKYYMGGSRENKIDFGIIDDDYELIIIGQCKFPNGDKEISDLKLEDIVSMEYNKDTVDEILIGLKRIESSTEVAGNNKFKLFAAEYKRKQIEARKNLKMIVVAFGNFNQDAAKYAIDNNVEIYDFNRIKEEYILKSTPAGHFQEPKELDLKFIGQYAQCEGEHFNAYTFYVDADTIAEAMDKYTHGLFLKNLRYKLEKARNSKLANEIKTTIKKNPKKMAILNNGITLVCSNISLHRARPDVVKLFDPKIVNGCQTCWAIYETYKEYQTAGRQLGAPIQVKIVKTIDSNVIQKIAEATNNQNPISERDKHAADPIQLHLFKEFDKFAPHVLYIYKDGLKEALPSLGRYQIQGRRTRGKPSTRELNNEECGQLYLCLLDKPIFAKTNKKEIFEKDEIYKTVFHYELSKEERFTNDYLNLNSRNINIRTGKISYFVEDIFFAYVLSKLAYAYTQLYNSKLNLYTDDDQEITAYKAAYKTLQEDLSFILRWKFILVAAVNHIVNKFARDDERKLKSIRQKLMGDDIELFWRPKLIERFNLNDDKEKYLLVLEDAPSPHFKLFSAWANSLIELLKEMVLDKKEEQQEAFNMRNFIELSEDTYSKLTYRIDQIFAGRQSGINQFFPQTI